MIPGRQARARMPLSGALLRDFGREIGIAELDTEGSAAGREARPLAHQAGARASSSSAALKIIRQSTRISPKPGRSAGSDMKSASQPHEHKPAFAGALAAAPATEEKKARGRVEARNREIRPGGGKGREEGRVCFDLPPVL